MQFQFNFNFCSCFAFQFPGTSSQKLSADLTIYRQGICSSRWLRVSLNDRSKWISQEHPHVEKTNTQSVTPSIHPLILGSVCLSVHSSPSVERSEPTTRCIRPLTYCLGQYVKTTLPRCISINKLPLYDIDQWDGDDTYRHRLAQTKLHVNLVDAIVGNVSRNWRSENSPRSRLQNPLFGFRRPWLLMMIDI
jgi:hypothetical protein